MMFERKMCLFGVFVAGWCAVTGCSPDESSKSETTSVAKSAIPAFDDVTLQDLKSDLADGFTVIKSGPPQTVLQKESDAGRVVIVAMHDAAGRIQTVTGSVIVNPDQEQQSEEVLTQALSAVSASVGVTTDEEFTTNAQIGEMRTRMGFGHSFAKNDIYIRMDRTQPLNDSWQWTDFEPGQVVRGFRLLPLVASVDDQVGPIEGASLAQLKELLDGFTEVAKVEGQQHLFVRDMEDHCQVVHAMVNDKGQITLIEAFVGNLAEGANRAELNEQLWVKLAGLEYRNSNTEEAIAKLTGPQPNYAVSAYHMVGYGMFCLPFGADGKRNLLAIWARDPEKD